MTSNRSTMRMGRRAFESIAGERASFVAAGVIGFLVGAWAMFILDPQGGRPRRAYVRDKATRYRRELVQSIRGAAIRAERRARGVAARAQAAIRPEEPVSDAKLHDRVRSAMGRAVSHAGSIKVDVDDGEVTLSGPILAYEVDGLMRTVARVRGVRAVINDLLAHEAAENVPGLQG